MTTTQPEQTPAQDVPESEIRRIREQWKREKDESKRKQMDSDKSKLKWRFDNYE